MTKKISFYGNFVVKYQEGNEVGEWGWIEFAPKINEVMTNLRKDLQEILPCDCDKDDIELTTSYHVWNPMKGRAYYKIEVKFPSLLGIQHILKVE